MSRRIVRRTTLLTPKPLLLDRANDGKWRFCPRADCHVVYFADDGSTVFTTDDVRVRARG